MKTDDALRQLGEFFGVLPSFRDLARQEHVTSTDTQKALLQANGLVLDNDGAIHQALATFQAVEKAQQYPRELIIQSRQAQVVAIPGVSQWQVLDWEEGSAIIAEGNNRQSSTLALPALPSGVYDLSFSASVGNGVVT